MGNRYTKEIIEYIMSFRTPVIVETDYGPGANFVSIGYLTEDDYGRGYALLPLQPHENKLIVPRSYIKKIVGFNGCLYPKELHEEHKMLDLFELNDLVNRAGYELT